MPIPHRRVLLIGIVALAAIRPASAQQIVTSKWTGSAGAPWADADNWNNIPDVGSFPNNNDEFQYQAEINGATIILNEDVEIRTLDLNGGTIQGTDSLEVLGILDVTPSGSFTGGPGMLQADFINVSGGMLFVEDWDVETKSLDLGNNELLAGTLQLSGTSQFTFGRLTMWNNGSISGRPRVPNGEMPLLRSMDGTLESSRGTHPSIPLSSVAVRFESNDGIVAAVDGELRFIAPSPPGPLETTHVTLTGTEIKAMANNNF